MPKITKSIVDKLSAGRHDTFAWDSTLPGFGVRAKPSGVKSYIIQYRNRSGKSRRFTISRHGVMTPDEARIEARQLLAAIDKGADPAAGVANARMAPTIAGLAERFLKEYSKPHKKASSAAEDERLINRRVNPRLGGMKIADVTRADVAKLHHQMRDTPYEANRTLALLSKMFNLAELWGLRPDGSNPTRHVKRYREAKRERFLTEDELGRLGTSLETMVREDDITADAALAIRLLALTGCRLSEILNLSWDSVDLDTGVIRLADAKAGPRIVPLGSSPKELLKARSHRTGFVCRGAEGNSPITIWSLEAAWRKVRTQSKLSNVRLHDLRHTVGTYSGQSGHNAFIVRDLLGHKTLAMTGRYVERDTDPLRAAAETVSGRIATAMKGERSG